MGVPTLGTSPMPGSHHQEVVEEEDLTLVQPQTLGAVRVGDFVELAAANQAAVGQGQDLERFPP